MSTRSTGTSALLALCIGLAACAPAPPPAPPPDTTAEDTSSINAVRDAWMAGYNAGDAQAVANLYTEDAIDMPAGQPALTGRTAIRDAMAAQLGMGRATVTVTSDELQLMGDWAFDRGTYSTTMVPAAGGDSMMMSGRYMVILRRQTDGSWKLVRGIDNSPTPPPAAVSGSN